MFTRIVVPISGYALAERALVPAANIARAHGAELHLVMADIQPTFTEFDRHDTGGYIEHELRALADRLRTEFGVSVTIAAPPSEPGVRNPSELLATYIREVGADLVVMATHGHVGWLRAWTGSVADDLMHRVAVPMLLIRSTSIEHGSGTGFGRVVVAMDGSTAATQFIAPAMDLMDSHDATLTLCQVVTAIPAEVDAPETGGLILEDAGLTRRLVAETRSRLSTVVAGLAVPPGRRVVVRVDALPIAGPLSPIGPAIVRACKELRADLVVLTTHERRASRLVIPTVADHVLHDTGCAVLICHRYSAKSDRDDLRGTRQSEPATTAAGTG